jgi:hypothetical protein
LIGRKRCSLREGVREKDILNPILTRPTAVLAARHEEAYVKVKGKLELQRIRMFASSGFARQDR